MKIDSIAIPVPIQNVDTDQIIPAEFLKQTDKKGYGVNLFAHWRYTPDGRMKKSIFNDPEFRKAEVLLAGANFGCGSSREHAAWAIAGFGIKAVISSKFADIFKGNAYNNGIIPIELDTDIIEDIFKALANDPFMRIKIDLQAQTVEIPTMEVVCRFEIDAFKKECMLKGVDETAYLIGMKKEIMAYEKKMNAL